MPLVARRFCLFWLSDMGKDHGQQCANFTSYDAHNVFFQNCVAIDSGDDDNYLYGRLYGGFWFENKETTALDNSFVLQESIALNLGGDAAIKDPNSNGTHVIENTVIWDSKGGYSGGRISGAPETTMSHMTIGNIWGSFSDTSYAYGTSAYASDSLIAQISDSILAECNSFALAGSFFSDYNVYSGNATLFGGRYQQAVPSLGPNDVVEAHGLQYLPRAEESALASDGGFRGATIQYRRGVSGTLFGESGWDTLTEEPLWPFPQEGAIQEAMSNWDGQNDPTRGLCADDIGLYGGPVTLTSYIWEYLGNTCPADICAY